MTPPGPGGERLIRDSSRRSLLEELRAGAVPQLPGPLEAARVQLQEAAGPEAEPPRGSHGALADGTLGSIEGLKPLLAVPQAEADAGATAAPERLRVAVASVSNAVAASGTHNVILGLRAFLDKGGLAGSELWGIRSLAKGNEFEIVSSDCQHYLNQGGCDLLPTITLAKATDRLVKQVAAICERMELDGLLFLCGPSELAEVTKISEFFGKTGVRTGVHAVVHSLSGWVQVPPWVETNLGFDSASGILAEVAGNFTLRAQRLNRDAYHFVSCGSPTLTLELAMQTHPTLCYLGADVAERGLLLQGIIDEICDVVVSRHHDHGLHSGVVMVSDDFFERLVEMRQLRDELCSLRKTKPADMRSVEGARESLPPELRTFFEMLPADVCHALVLRTDVHGMPMLLPQETERELGSLVTRCLSRRRSQGEPTVDNFDQQPHSLRHIAVSPMPTLFDCQLGYALGHVAGALVQARKNGYAASMRDVLSEPTRWVPCAVPLAWLLRPGPDGAPAVLRRQLTPEDALLSVWCAVRDRWRWQLSCRQPGPVQFWGPSSSSWPTYTLRASCQGAKALLRELSEEETGQAPEDFEGVVSDFLRFRLKRRQLAMLSPLQRWRATYEPKLPKVFRGRFRIVEAEQKGRVCADLVLLSKAFPSLWRTDQLKTVRIVQKAKEEVGVVGSLVTELNLDEAEIDAEEDRTPTPFNRQISKGTTEDLMLDFPRTRMRVGVALVGRAAPGANNVVMGLHSYVTALGGTVVCIVMGIHGIRAGLSFELTPELLAVHLNQGGSDLLGQSQPEDLDTTGGDFAACAKTVRRLQLSGLVIWGGTSTHSWTVGLAEYFSEHQVSTSVVAVPASVQSDLPLVEQSLGYDSVCKMFASIVGNLATQAASSGMLWCFVRIPGRSISHIAAEIALQTHPHVLLTGQTVEDQSLGLPEVTQLICDVVEERAREGRNYGVVLIPDQLLSSVREMRQLFGELAMIRQAFPDVLEAPQSGGVTRDWGPLLSLMPPLSRALLQSFPERTRAQVCSSVCSAMDQGQSDTGEFVPDLRTVETEVMWYTLRCYICESAPNWLGRQIFQTLVETEMHRRVLLGTYKGPFKILTYSLPLQGRAAMPTNFDCDLGYTSGYTAGVLIDSQCTGVFVDVSRLKESVDDWEVGGTSLASLVGSLDLGVKRTPGHCRGKGGRSQAANGIDGTRGCEQKAGKMNHQAPSYKILPRKRLMYDLSRGSEFNIPEAVESTLLSPGSAQFAGPCAGEKTKTLCMPQLQRVRQMALMEEKMAELKAKASEGPNLTCFKLCA
ncbi:unnamed protein product [Prorocentrum cordatum]|uniref:Phosphofructokinase domain-containing protein n=1 Tax=Prorocentrum cordatum TaxID=2364126 RepID=A0ABN9Q9K9_9DINO|nr:unnamed protein product [Polarella glacialis]